jgi:hypothetical protein
MANKGRPTKHILTYEQQVWDNYNPYSPAKEASDKELLEHKKDVGLERLQKQLTKLAQLAGYEEINKGLITSISKRLLSHV